MERDLSTPLSSLLLSSQVFRPPYPPEFSSRFGNGGLGLTAVVGNKDNIFVVPQHRVPLNLSIRRRSFSVYPGDERTRQILQVGNDKIRHSDHSLKINKVLKVPCRTEFFSELGSHGLVSEGSASSMYWSPVTLPDNQVAGKLLMPSFYNMKATCGQRTTQGGIVLSPNKHSSSVGNIAEGLRLQPTFPPTLVLNSQGNSSNMVNEILESGRYDCLKSPARIYSFQREKCLSVTYKEQRPDKQTSTAALNRLANVAAAYGVAGDVESRLRINDAYGDRFSTKNKKNVVSKVDESRENVKSNLLQRSAITSADEGSEEFVSRAATPDDDASVRDGDSQAWDDDDEAVDDEEDITDADDALLEGDDEDDEVGDRNDSQSSRHVARTTSAGSALILRDASAVDIHGGLSASKKQLSPAPLSRIRIAQQEQQKRLRDNIGIDKNRPTTGCSVVFNGSANHVTSTALRNRLAALPKRSITRPPTATATSTANSRNEHRSSNGELAPFHRRATNKVGATSPDSKILQPLQPSLFSNVPGTLVFAGEDNSITQLSREMKNLLRWRTSTITPNVMKRILARSNFKMTSKDDVWVGCWAKHMKQEMFKSLREFQKFNHFPGSFQIGRKDRLWRNLSAMQARFGRREFSFFPQTYVLPGDYKLLKRVMEETEKRQRWILKPPASARGNGIRCVCTIKQVPKKRPVIVQKYIHQPYLINESKFDIRLYVYVTCYDPLKAYIFNDGLARFASSKYSSSLRDLPNKFMHLTNYSINKHNSEYQSNGDQDACSGHKWSLHALWNHLASLPSEEECAANGNIPRKPVDVGQLWAQIKDIAVKALLAAEQHVVSAVKMNVVNRYAVHELFGFDILLDRDLRPWLLEVNISPSLHSDSPLDCKVKGEMLKDLLNLAGYRLPDPISVRSNAASNGEGDAPAPVAPTDGSNNNDNSSNNNGTLAGNSPSLSSCFDPRLVSSGLSVDERSKHSYFTQNWRNDSVSRTLLDTLTPDDLRLLVEFEDERSRIGGWEAIFPTTQTHSYLKMMDPPRYYNLLLDSWLRCYGDDVDGEGNPINRHEKGLEFLDSLCRKGLHLENPTSDWRHIWRPPPLGAPVHRPNASSANNLSPSSNNNNGNSTAATAVSTPSPPGNGASSNNSKLAGAHSHSTGSLPSFNDS